MIKTLYETAEFLARTAPIVILATYATHLALKSGFLERLTAKTFGIAAASLSTAVISPTASYSLISQVWREGKISDRDVVALTFLNSLPTTLNHLLTFYVPFVIPVLGFAGIVYTMLRLSSAVIRSAVGFLMLRKRELPKAEGKFESSWSRNVARALVVMTVTFFAVNAFFEHFQLPKGVGLATIAGIQVLNARAAIVAAAALIDEYGWKPVVAVLMLSNVVTLSARAFRHSLPFHVAIFGKFGVKVVLYNSLLSAAVDIALVAVLLSF
ncbi:MAG: nucleoside recognition protein [Archaeoglobaceae archaeon]